MGGRLQDMDWQKMISSSKANLEFLQWLHARYSWQDPMPGYQPSERRKLAKGGLVSEVPTPSSRGKAITSAAGGLRTAADGPAGWGSQQCPDQ